MLDMDASEVEIVRAAMRIIRGVNSPAQQAASRQNGKKGGRPSGALKPLDAIECTCGSDEHKSTCLRGRAIRRRAAGASDA
jgi:hypothetical protein